LNNDFTLNLNGQREVDMVEFLRGWGALIVAGLALIQPWVITVWRKILGTVDIFETGRIEIGYALIGPTIGLNGTLRAVRTDQFVQGIELKIVRLKDGAQYSLKWAYLRPPKLSLGGQDTSAELPSGFLLNTVQPFRYNIVFSDIKRQTEMEGHLTHVAQAWGTEWSSSGLQDSFSIMPQAPQIQRAVNELYKRFTNSTAYKDAVAELNRILYWEPGRYHLEMQVHTARPCRSFTHQWTFEISKEGSDNLRQNIAYVLSTACGHAAGVPSRLLKSGAS
jgi:hypothetical protein